MLKLQAVQAILNAFAGLFTQPFEQDLKTSVRAAATSIALAGFPGLAFQVNRGGRTALEIGGFSLMLVLVWMAMTAVLAKTERRKLMIARNLSVVSFWIAVTLVFIFAVELVFTHPLDRAIRLLGVLILLPVPVLVHMLRNLPCVAALLMTVLLWLSMGALAWSVIY